MQGHCTHCYCKDFPMKMRYIWMRVKKSVSYRRLYVCLLPKHRLWATRKWPTNMYQIPRSHMENGLVKWRAVYHKTNPCFFFFCQGVHLEVDSAKSLAVSLDAANIPDEPYFNTLLRIMATRCMMQAVYFCSGMLPEEEFLHYGLATPIYTHFTSPIRRFVITYVCFQFNNFNWLFSNCP